jgi:hypothetical protein
MFKDTCLIALKRKDQSPHIPDLEVFIHIILEVLVRQLRNDFPNAQAYNHTNATIIRIRIALREI